MKRLFFAVAAVVCMASLDVTGLSIDPSYGIPKIVPTSAVSGFRKIANVAQYAHADWSHMIGMAKGISLAEAEEIAANNPDITFFFYTKGYQMVLGSNDGSIRVFRHGDTVFFSGTPWWGSAPGLADGYVRD